MLDRIGYLFGRFAPQWAVEWWLEYRHGMKPFRPCAIQFDEDGSTQILLTDEFTVWRQWGSPDHPVDLGYNKDGRLIGVRIGGRVLTR